MSDRQKARACILVRHEPCRPDLLGPLSEMGSNASFRVARHFRFSFKFGHIAALHEPT